MALIYCLTCGHSAEKAIADDQPCVRVGHTLVVLPDSGNENTTCSA